MGFVGKRIYQSFGGCAGFRSVIGARKCYQCVLPSIRHFGLSFPAVYYSAVIVRYNFQQRVQHVRRAFRRRHVLARHRRAQATARVRVTAVRVLVHRQA